jgi:HPt (histidine-containing phosphotransfer) domain-containing protein
MASLIDEEFFARLRALNDKFTAGVPAMLDRLVRARAAFDPAQPAPALIHEIQALLHTMAGSAATFGFRVLGQEARALEQRLRVLMAFEAIAPADWNHWFAGLDEFVRWAAHDPKADYYKEEFEK